LTEFGERKITRFSQIPHLFANPFIACEKISHVNALFIRFGEFRLVRWSDQLREFSCLTHN
jgi:hypothetical protein